MAIRKVLLRDENEDFLRKVSKPVVEFDDNLVALINDMIDTLHKYDGLGLAAPQIGVLKRIAIVEVGDVYLELINPVITSKEGSIIRDEGCLSLPGLFKKVERPAKVSIRAFDRHGFEYEYTAEGLLARAICHEMDHLDGHLFVDFVVDDKKTKGDK